MDVITSKRRKKHLSGGGVKAREYISKTANNIDYIAFSFKGIDMERVPKRTGLLFKGSRLYFVADDDGFSPHAENGSKTSAVINVSKERLGDVDVFLGDYPGLEYDPDVFSYYIDYEHKGEEKTEQKSDNITEKICEFIGALSVEQAKTAIDLIQALAEEYNE